MSENVYTTYMQSAIGWVEITATNEYITSIVLVNTNDKWLTQQALHELPKFVQKCVQELEEYFEGTRTEFTVPLMQQGTDFQQKVWLQLLQIPYGTTISYMELAKRMGDEKLTRAVGAANGKNKIWMVVPCHRVIGSDGSLTGYAGGIEVKRWLLQHEAQHAKPKDTLF